jgi:acetoin utilization deacetylase AcuC-like enzyme
MRQVGFVYSDELKGYNYGPMHPMKMNRAAMVFDLLLNYDALADFNLYVP